MLHSKAAKPVTIRNHNRKLVLQVIEKAGQIFRADIAKMTRISEPTISLIVEHLIQKGLVRELGPGESIGGRKPVMIEFNPDIGYVVGIDAGGTNIKMGISDLGGQFIYKKTFRSKDIGSGRTAVTGLAGLVRQIIVESNLNTKKVLGVGLSVPGITDPDEGSVSYSPAFGWHELPLGPKLSDDLELPVSVENDVNAAALAEKQWGAARDYQNFAFISIGTGIGAGLILNGELYRGHLNAAGEIGYTIVDINWIRRQENPDNLSFGCLESMAAAPGIVKRAKELGFSKKGDGPEELQTEDVFEGASQGDPIALQIIDEVTDYLAAGIINIALVISPQAVVFGGGVTGAGDILLDPLRRKINTSSPVKPAILLSSMQADAGLIGAASLAVRRAKQDLIED